MTKNRAALLIVYSFLFSLGNLRFDQGSLTFQFRIIHKLGDTNSSVGLAGRQVGETRAGRDKAVGELYHQLA